MAPTTDLPSLVILNEAGRSPWREEACNQKPALFRDSGMGKVPEGRKGEESDVWLTPSGKPHGGQAAEYGLRPAIFYAMISSY